MIDEKKKELLLLNQQHLGEDAEMMKDIVSKHENVRERAVSYTYQLITALGLVAGFGFTAISSVNKIFYFILGEAFIFVAMAVGMWFVKVAFIDEAKNYADYIDKLDKAMNERMAISFRPTIEEIELKLESIKQKELTIFNDGPANYKSDWFFRIILTSFVIGAASLLFSLLH